MGNKLCAPLLKKPYRQEDHPWHMRKDSHLLRLWAEVFRVHGDGEYMRWERVSEDVVPINVSCIEDTPSTVFHITAYNRHVEKIFDVRISQPGTIICPATESFVHWRDASDRCEWGLNFTTSADAKRFRDCCTNPVQKFARKANSANSLRLSPPKRVKGREISISSPSSPIRHQNQLSRRAISTPYELSHPGEYELEEDGTLEITCDQKKEKSATIPRTVGEAEQDLETFKPIGILKPPSSSSVYDNVTGNNVSLRKSSHHATNDTRNNRRSMPPLSTSHVSFVVGNLRSDARPASSIQFTQQFYPQDDNDLVDSGFRKNTGTSRNSVTFGEISDINLEQNGNSIRSKENVRMETAFVGDVFQNNNLSGPNSPAVTYIDTATTVLAPKPSLSNVSRESKKSSSSESPEWPSPPEPLTPLTPINPECNVDFDSDILKRMLQSLPVSPDESNMDRDQGFHEDVYYVNKNSNSKKGLSRTKSLNTHDRVNKPSKDVRQSTSVVAMQVEQKNGNVKNQTASSSRSSKSKPTKLSIEEELRLRNKCVRDSYGQESYPDSGIGGMTGDTGGSVCSGNSAKVSKPGGLDINTSKLGAGSSGGSSQGSSSSGRHSDLINQLGDNSEIKQFLSSELSDDDGAESDDSIHTMTEAESRVSFTKQFGAIRKAGWLVVKNWLVHRKRKLELAPKRKWKRYWVCLKGTVLLFFDCCEDTLINENSIPRHILVIEGGIAQAVPEDPKRDNIFSLSTAFGDAYLFQAQSAMELESWICAVHSACASSFARQHGKDNTLRLMKSELHKLEANIDVDVKMRKMAELQLTVVTDPRSRQAIIKQIGQWEENLEKLFIEQYRIRCYIASLQGTELPNPKVLLASASRTSKTTLGRLGIFTVTSFHALVAARKPLVVPNIYGKGNHKGGMLSPRGDGTFKYSLKTKDVRSPTRSPSSEAVYKATDIDEVVADLYTESPDDMSCKSDGSSIRETLSRIALPNNQTILVGVDKRTSVQDLLESVCSKRQLNPQDHYVRIKFPNTPVGNYTIPDPQQNIKRMKYESIEVCQKSVFQLQLVKSSLDSEFGFTVEAELADDYERDDELRLYISNVTAGSVAQRSGISIGDEILVINGKIVSELDMVFIETLLHESQSLCLTVRSLCSHNLNASINSEQSDIDIMMCPPPPTQSRIPEKVIGNLIVPAPLDSKPEDQEEPHSPKKHESLPDLSHNQIDTLLKGADQVTAICRTGSDSNVPRGHSNQNLKPLSEAQKLKKVILELIETERAYVKDLECLIEMYLEPLKQETFLTSDEIDQLFGNIQEIVQFQRQFLQSLEEAMHLEGDFYHTDDCKSFRRVLFSLGGSFLYYANHFKVYSSFCASHSRSQKILNPVANDALKAFLNSRNPNQQHSATLESYLIKPIQRILKYPLLLQQFCNLTDEDTDEHYHLSEAHKGMAAVAEHINEMQKIFEEYGPVFDELSKMFRETYLHKKPVDLSVGELQMYGTVEWCNICDTLGKVKKGLDLENIVFVFKTGVVFLCRERVKKKAKPKDKAMKGQTELFECQEKFRTLIPVQEVQVKNGKLSDIQGHYWWDLIHCQSEKDGRSERMYQFCNSSSNAKSDFMKIIRQTIRESVRKMALPNSKQLSKKTYVPYGGKRLENLSSNVRTLSKMRGGNKSSQGDGESDRLSMDFDESVTILSDTDSSFRTRSRTVGDLNDVSLENPENDPVSNIACSEPHLSPERKSTCSSNSNLSISSRNSTSAKLMHASANPLTFSSTSIDIGEGANSPVWKPRNAANTVYLKRNKLSAPCLHTSSSSSSLKSVTTHADYSDIVFRRDSKTIVLQQATSSLKLKDTEC